MPHALAQRHWARISDLSNATQVAMHPSHSVVDWIHVEDILISLTSEFRLVGPT